jgi:phenylacetic acid degradation operon negative regulatory protein
MCYNAEMSSSRTAENLSKDLLQFVLRCVSIGIGSVFGIQRELARLDQPPVSKRTLAQKLYYAKRRGYVVVTGNAEAAHYRLEPKGEQKLAQLSFSRIEFSPQSWDGLWRIVMFDIPESHRSARDEIRRLIKQIGMRQLQQSVWLTPADCRSEFEQLVTAYGVNEHLVFVEAKTITAVERLRKSWGL